MIHSRTKLERIYTHVNVESGELRRKESRKTSVPYVFKNAITATKALPNKDYMVQVFVPISEVEQIDGNFKIKK